MKLFLKSVTKKTLFLVLLTSSLTLFLSILLVWFRPQLAVDLVRFLSPAVSPTPLEFKGLAVLGDSQSDEYRADDSRGLTYASTTKNWVEHLVDLREINVGENGTFEEPRRSGFAYNFARSGATTLSMIESGQHASAAELVKEKKVNAVVIFIGTNDFSPIHPTGYDAIYNESLIEADVIRKKNDVVSGIKTAIQTVQSSGEVRIILVTIPDWGRNPVIRITYPDPLRRAKVTEVVNDINTDLKTLLTESEGTVIDINEFYESLLDQEDKKVRVGSITLINTLPSDNPRHFFLDDGIHTGSLVNALFAREVILRFNDFFTPVFTPLTEAEMLSNSGL